MSEDKEDSKLTEIYGVKLKSEHKDKKIYDSIRTVQYLLALTHSLTNEIRLKELKFENNYLCEVYNKNNKLTGYIARNVNSDKILYLVLDQSRKKWMKLEGFNLSPENCQKVGMLGKVANSVEFANFIAGKKGFEIQKYFTSNDIIPK